MPTGRYTKPVLIVVALIATLALVMSLSRGPSQGHGSRVAASGSPGAPPPKLAGPAELALVAPLKKGGKLLDYDVNSVGGVEGGVIWVIVKKDQAIVYLTIALASDAGALAPVAVGPYALFSSGLKVPPGDQARLLTALGEIVKANAGAPMPPGLSTYKPGPMPGDER